MIMLVPPFNPVDLVILKRPRLPRGFDMNSAALMKWERKAGNERLPVAARFRDGSTDIPLRI
jgi:hypothetical protein